MQKSRQPGDFLKWNPDIDVELNICHVRLLT